MTAEPVPPTPRGRTRTGAIPDPEGLRKLLREWMEEPETEEDIRNWEAFKKAMNESKPQRPPYP